MIEVDKAAGKEHRRRRLLGLACGGMLMMAPALASAHFILVSPTPTLEQDGRGDPQKLGPCGGTSANPGTPTGAVTTLKGGDKLHIKIQETVFHPGHYRVALARNALALPPDPETVTREGPRGPVSVSAAIADKPSAPILADGLFQHTERPAAGSFWEADVPIPNIDCSNCVVQVIQWMAEHGYNRDGGYSYHHCATVNIVRNRRLPRVSWPS